jgi:multisubunit Na+/H+ antiporter MnhB subunit
MAKFKQSSNPFYAVLVLLGVTFAVTACAYALMTYRALDVRLDSAHENGLMRMLANHGAVIMGVEVLLLSVATLGAIALDQLRLSRAQRNNLQEDENGQ